MKLEGKRTSPAEYENIRLENEQLQAVFDAVEAHNLWCGLLKRL